MPEMQGSDHAPAWVDLEFHEPLPCMPPPGAPVTPETQTVTIAPPLSTRVRFRVAGKQATLLQQLAKPRVQPPSNGSADQQGQAVASQGQVESKTCSSSQEQHQVPVPLQPPAQHVSVPVAAMRKSSGRKDGLARKPSQQSMLAFAVPKRPHPSSELVGSISQGGSQSQGQPSTSSSAGWIQQAAAVHHTSTAPADRGPQGNTAGGQPVAQGNGQPGDGSRAQLPQPMQQAGVVRNEAAKNVWQVSNPPPGYPAMLCFHAQ
jgi:hypothetical protein